MKIRREGWIIFLITRPSLDYTGFRVALPILSAWREVIPTGADNIKTCKVVCEARLSKKK